MAEKDSKIYKYPELPPVGSAADAGLSQLGLNWNRGGEGITPWVDYMWFQEYRPEYNGKAVLESIKNNSTTAGAANESRENLGNSVYLYMPSNVAVNYSSNYNNTKFGVGGLAAAQMLGASGSNEIASTLRNAAGGATPESGFKAVADATNALSSFLGVEGSVSGSDLAAVSQGRIFNPYEEQIFNGVNFRAHSFNWKLVARDNKEATEIAEIVKFFKMVMLPTYNDVIGDTSKTSTPSSSSPSTTSPKTPGEALTSPFANVKNRYLNVPKRVKVQFIRVYLDNGTGQLNGNKTAPIKLFQMKDCVIDGLQVNYTPDGGYVNTNDGYVPALEMQLSLKEVSIVTADDVKDGF
jgi:hypothetical protein